MIRHNYIYRVVAILSLCVVVTACNFGDVLLDADGQNINLVRLDLPKYDARYRVQIVDQLGDRIDDATIELNIWGDDALNMITDVGRILMLDNTDQYREFRTTEYGLFNFNLNPNLKVASRPIKFQIGGSTNSESEYVVIPKIVDHAFAGDINIYLTAVPVDVQQSASVILGDPFYVLGGNAQKVASLSGQNGAGYEMIALYRSDRGVKRNFTIECAGTEYESYGIYLLHDDMFAPASISKAVEPQQYFIVAAKRKNMIRCALRVNVESAVKGIAASLPYTIYDRAGDVVLCGEVSGIAPLSSVVEQIYLPADDPVVTIELHGTNSLDISMPNLQNVRLSDRSVAQVNFEVVSRVEASSTLHRYDISVEGVCDTDRQIAFMPSVRFQYTVKDAGCWEWCESRAGKIVVMLEPDQDYTIRIPINNSWQTFDITTSKERIERIVRDQPNVNRLDLKHNPDGSISLDIDYQDPQFCDL